MKLVRNLITVAMIIALAGACRHGGNKPFRPAIDPELLKLSKEQLFEKGEENYNKRRYEKARTYFSYLYESFPNDPLGRRSLLRVADTYFGKSDAVNLVEAQYKYRDFINRYPGSDRADYAMLQIANVSYKQMERPDRDQQKTREAVEKFNDMIRTFPKSSLRPEADKKLQEALDRLAKHEQIVARYYMKRKSYDAAVRRLNGLVDSYPNYRDRDSVFFDLAMSLESLGRKGEARLYFERVMAEFPSSKYSEKAKQRLGRIKA